MSQFTTIDLSDLPSPNIVEELDFDAILAATNTELQNIAPKLNVDSVDLSSRLLEVMALRELDIRQRINAVARGVMLATATGSDLDNLVALFNVQRAQTNTNDTEVDPIYEDDVRLRERAQVAFEGFSTAGSQGAYIFHALSASAEVKDVSVFSDTPGAVEVRILSVGSDGAADQSLLETVQEALNDNDVRPITDEVVVGSANIIAYTVNARLVLYSDVDNQAVLDSAQAALETYMSSLHVFGADVTVAGLFSVLFQPGVQNVELTEPISDILVDKASAAYASVVAINCVEYSSNPPINLAEAINFIDEDGNIDEIQGTVTITPASDEIDISHYVLYWGENDTEKLPCGARIHTFDGATLTLDHQNLQDNAVIKNLDTRTTYARGTDYELDSETGEVTSIDGILENAEVNVTYQLQPITSWAKDESLVYPFPPDTPIPTDATHLLVFTENAFGEMPQGIGVEIVDRGASPPFNPAIGIRFTDSDAAADKIGGEVMITPAADQTDITHYVLYWGENDTQKLPSQELMPIGTIDKGENGDDLVYNIPDDTGIPEDATHLLVFSGNTFGEMTDGISVEILSILPIPIP